MSIDELGSPPADRARRLNTTARRNRLQLARQSCDNLAACPRQIAPRLFHVKVAVIALQWVIRVFAVVQLTLGGLFWSGNAFTLIPLHMLSGLLLVVGLWAQAALALRAGVHPAFPVVAIAWGVLV